MLSIDYVLCWLIVEIILIVSRFGKHVGPVHRVGNPVVPHYLLTISRIE